MPTPTFSAEERSAMISEMESAPVADAAPAPAVVAAPAEAPAEEAPAAEPEAPAEEPGTSEEEPADAPDAQEEADEPAVDPQTARSLDQLQKARKRSDSRLSQREAEISRRESELAHQLEELGELRRAKERAKADPEAWLKVAGYTEEDFDLVGRRIYYASPTAAKADPKAKAAYESQQRERFRDRDREEQHSAVNQKVDALQAEIGALRAERWLDGVASKVDGESPHVANLLNKNRTRGLTVLNDAARYLAKEAGEEPTPLEVIEFLEKTLGDEAEMLGYERLTTKKTTKPKTLPAGESKTATKTLNNNLTTRTQPRSSPKTPQEERAATIAEMEEAARMG